jgi:acyl carrier protein phosphodiesterase
MNYLAHLHLSNNDKNLIIGNYIADDVKGKAYLNFPLEIQKGIILHRKIDDFTDSHKVVGNSKNLIRHHQNKFTPVVMDVFYDYFLAKNWEEYSTVDLLSFTTNIYKVLFKNMMILPLKSQARLHFMAKSNWLYNYRKIEGIEKALKGMSKRTKYPNNMQKAHLILKEQELNLQKDFDLFYLELINFVDSEIKKGTEI